MFTIRNGNEKTKDKPYCEKILIVDEKQYNPLHYHYFKTEDIINRGGGNIVFELFYGDKKDHHLKNTPVKANIDSVIKSVKPGEKLILKPG